MHKVSLLCAMSIFSAPALLCQDFFGAGVSAQTAARAGIYVPSDDNALDALALNPAGLSALTGKTLNLSAMGLLARGEFSNSGNHDSPMRTNAGALPFGAFGMPIGKRWTVAAGFLPDLLSAAKWQYQDVPGVGGANYGPQHEKSAITAFRSTAGFAYQFSSRVSVGMTGSVIYNSNTLIMPYIFQSNPALKGLKTLLDLHTTGVNWNTSLGVTARLTSRWQLGASYRTKSSITSAGTATGNLGAQFAALQIPFRPDFAYQAQVGVELPQAALVNVVWQKSPALRISAETTFSNWQRSFESLPVSLTNGNNADINTFLQSNAIKDLIPLQWKNQFSFRGAAERSLGENLLIAGGYMHQNNPVPSSTLTPLTAAILANSLTTGLGYRRGRARFDVAYQFSFTATQNVATSALLWGEFNNSQVRVGTQALTLSAAFHL